MELCVWPSGWGLSSVEFDCLQSLTYARLANVPVTVRHGRCSLLLRSLAPPMLTNKAGAIHSSFDDILAYLQREGFDTDDKLSPQQAVDIAVWSSLFESKLQAALIHLWWLDKNHAEIACGWSARVFPWGFGALHVAARRRRAKKYIDANFGALETNAIVQQRLYEPACDFLKSLADFLGDKRFLLGDHASSLDARAFGYLAPLLRIPFASNCLSERLQSLPNLVQYVGRIQAQCFPTASTEPSSDQKTTPQSTIEEFDHPKRNIILFTAASTLVMMVYAWVQGIVQFDWRSEDDSGAEYVEDSAGEGENQ